MKTTVAWVALVVILITCSASARERPLQKHGSYPYCNVYADIACFGMAGGDLVTMSLHAYFLLYDIKLAGAIGAKVYVGEHAQISTAPFRTEVERCIDTSEPCKFVSRDEGGIWAIYVNQSGTQLELRIPPLRAADEGRAIDFVSGFRACITHASSVSCESDPLFADQVKLHR
jgi:hypothetical protein